MGLAHAEAPASLRAAWVPGPQQLSEQLLEFSFWPYSLCQPPKVTPVTQAMPTAFAVHPVLLPCALPCVLECPPPFLFSRSTSPPSLPAASTRASCLNSGGAASCWRRALLNSGAGAVSQRLSEGQEALCLSFRVSTQIAAAEGRGSSPSHQHGGCQ